MSLAMAWYGQRKPWTAAIPAFDVPMALLRRTGRFSLYDDNELLRLLESVPNAQLIAHEFRFPTAQQNREASERALSALRQKYPSLAQVKSIAKGSDDPRQKPVTDVMRALYSTVDLEIRR